MDELNLAGVGVERTRSVVYVVAVRRKTNGIVGGSGAEDRGIDSRKL